MSFVQSQYLPTTTQEWDEGICIGLGFFGLGAGNCGTYLNQTLTQVDVLGSVALNWVGDAPYTNWNPVAFSWWYALQAEYIAMCKLAMFFLGIIIIPELYVFKKKHNITIF